MYISFRRFRLTVFLLSCLLAALLFRPVRSWIDQIAVKRLVDPAMIVSEVHWHRSQGVLELRDLAWSGDCNGSACNQIIDLHASRLWLAYDPLALVDGQATFPRAKAEDVCIEFVDQAVVDSKSPAWQQPWLDQLNRIREYNWKQHFTPVLAEEELVQQWRSRFSSWTTRSNSIRFETVGYVTEATDDSNPLRTDEQLDVQLVRSNELFNEYDEIIRLAESDESKIVESVKAREATFGEAVEGCISLDVVLIRSETTKAITDQLLRAAAREVWLGQYDYLRATEQLVRSGIALPEKVIGEDMRSTPQSNRWLIEEFSLSGVANSSNGASSFTAIGSLRAPAKLPGTPKQFGLAPSMNYQFSGQALRTNVYQVQSATDADVLHYQVNVSAATAAEDAEVPLSILCSSKNDEIEGEMSIAMPIVLAFVEREIASFEPEYVAKVTSKLPLEANFRIGGTWSKPTFESIDCDADWAELFVSEALENSVASALMESLTPIEAEFASTNLRLMQQLNREYTAARSSIEADRTVVASSVERIKKRVQEQSDVEFARTPATRMIIR